MGADRDGTIDLWSRGAGELYGWTATEVLGRPLSVLAPAERVDELQRRLLVSEGQELPPFETVRLAKDGTRLPVQVHVVPVRSEQGAVVSTLAVHRDLRRAHQAELALEASQEELRAHLADSPVPQSRVDLRGRVLTVNKAMEALLDESAEQLVGRDALQMYVPEEVEGLQQQLRRLASGEVTFVRQDNTLLLDQGRVVPVVLTAVVVEHDGERVLACSLEDTTALCEAQERLRLEADRFAALVQSMPVAVFTYDPEGVCTSSRGLALSHLGLADDELVGRSLLEMYEGDPLVVTTFLDSLAGHGRTLRSAHSGRDWETHYRPLRAADGAIVGGIGISLDLTERAAAEREVAANEARLRSLLRHAADVALVLDPQGRIVFASAAARGQLGYDERELLGKDANTFNHANDRAVVHAAWQAVLAEPGSTVRFECRVLHADGTWRWADHALTNLLHDEAVGGLVVNVRETTERRRVEDELRRLAVRDGLTGLANRTLLLDRAEQSLVAGRSSGAATGIVVLDVVGMTGVNEELGQEGGDEVLRTVGARLQAAVRPTDTVGRIGGDEFAVLLVDLASEEELRSRAAALVDALEDAGVRLRAGTSLGPAAGAGALLASAERAAALADGQGVVLRPPLGEDAPDDASIDALRTAIREGQLVLHYQPVLRLTGGEVVGAEALVRWQHPQRGLLAPAEFIPLAETSGLVVELGAWVLREACAQLAAWNAAGRGLSVGVNLSPRQLVDARFPELVRDVLASTGLPAERLVLEVTESALMDDPKAPDVLRALHASGVQLSLDDFGTGYSSLTYLKRFPVDSIKIDRSFVTGLGRDDDDLAIVASVVSLARAVGKEVVAEGVETAAQLAVLRELGADQAQGYLWSHPVPAAELEAWLDQARPALPHPSRVVPAPAAAAGKAAGASPEDAQRILELHTQGASLHTIAAALNAEGRRTPAGPRWTPKTVARVIAAPVPRV